MVTDVGYSEVEKKGVRLFCIFHWLFRQSFHGNESRFCRDPDFFKTGKTQIRELEIGGIVLWYRQYRRSVEQFYEYSFSA